MLKPETLEYLHNISKEYGVRKMMLFGSCLYKPEDEAGDIDLGVEGLDGINLCYFVGELLLSKELNKQVHVVDLSDDASIIPIILEEGVAIYEEKR
jgi:predicted nucleotidyltransferase